MASFTDQIKKDMYIKIDGSVYLVTDRRYKTQGRQGGLIIFGAKNIETGQLINQTVKAGTKFEEVETSYSEMQYLYVDGESAYFMNTSTYETIPVNLEMIGDYAQYLKEGDKYLVMFYEGKPVNLRKNSTVELKVVESVDAVKGDTANSATKIVTTETGYKVKVPLFIKQGDVLVINTETGEYSGRA
ncbi:elongation factor P [Candidatus Nomurabacteria bacterium]|uniref:Elongation factor P n=1 Tax=Candidatus Dojkabacteria bacterium TaxID=2099670 RepID=A0A955I2U8_9BACT|nr:elongation factor P [Candidatus Dojkabacteria bacterium]MCB9789678.1 elongation factor P [Candidatus Nomurabacteria bacterium]MCB9804019.1 elongation factor P [Candidatus Nomurabacteria bacterium]